jgi:hypothetical protein
MFNSPAESDYSDAVATNGGAPQTPHDDASEDARMSGNDLRAAHDKACEMVKHIEGNPEADAKLSKGWVQSKLTLINAYLTSVHDYLLHGKEDTDTNEHGDVREGVGGLDGGFLISIEKKLDR